MNCTRTEHNIIVLPEIGLEPQPCVECRTKVGARNKPAHIIYEDGMAKIHCARCCPECGGMFTSLESLGTTHA